MLFAEEVGMNSQEKRSIQRLRQKGVSFSAIADRLHINRNTIKSFCQRNEIELDEDVEAACAYCGKTIILHPHKKPKRFCSDQCRMDWWAKKRKDKSERHGEMQICAGCGQTFASYKKQKYCSHACYIQDRFGRKDHA